MGLHGYLIRKLGHTPTPPAEIKQLEEASASEDPVAVQTVFKSQYLQRPDAKRIEMDCFADSLVTAMENDHDDIASYLLSQGIPINICHFTMAVELKSYSFLQLFLDYGWDINTTIDSASPPPLSLVINDQKLTEWFLDHGADPNAECGSGLDLTPLSIAVSNAPFAVISLLFDHGGSIDHGQLLHYAMRRYESDRLPVLDYIVGKGAPINHVMYQNHLRCYHHQRAFGIGTPLHEAAEDGKLDVVEYLRAKRADPLIRDARGRLAVERAERYGRTKVVGRLRPLSISSKPYQSFTDGRRVGEYESG